MTTPGPHLSVLRWRGVVFVAAFLAADVAIALVACGTSPTDDDVQREVAPAETSTKVDAANDARGAVTPQAGKDAGLNCVHVTGECDIVLQDCDAGPNGVQECVVNASNKTECRDVQVSQQLPIGRACCPNAPSNPCLPFLSCIGNDCVDGGAPTGRCSPACCEGDDQKCGKSEPEGISGACDIKLISGTTELHNVCTYRSRCKPFRAEPCKAGETCLVEDTEGTASCVDLFGPGTTNRQPCFNANDCADGLSCFLQGDAGTCRYECLPPGSTPPFDAGVADGGPGRGGCPTSERCSILFSNRPSWYGLCALPDGG